MEKGRVGSVDMISKGKAQWRSIDGGMLREGDANVGRGEGFGGLPSVPLKVLRPIIRVAWGVKKSAYSE